MTDRRTINETIGFLSHFKADAEAGIPCQPDTIQMVIDRLRAAIAHPAPSPMFQHVASICAGDVALTAPDYRGEPPALRSAIVVGLQAVE